MITSRVLMVSRGCKWSAAGRKWSAAGCEWLAAGCKWSAAACKWSAAERKCQQQGVNGQLHVVNDLNLLQAYHI